MIRQRKLNINKEKLPEFVHITTEKVTSGRAVKLKDDQDIIVSEIYSQTPCCALPVVHKSKAESDVVVGVPKI
jgi:hypothetical protein